ncbi:MAG: formate dehydrogenase accessory sulfurtransferase FdhD [Chloroflexi bacterium]|nr:formate dehydrogenase accessory sulfurtransferase FdhD [Chloroflexota bacterium]
MQETIGVSDIEGRAENVVCDRFSDAGWVNTSTHVPVEKQISIFVNRQVLVNILCTPNKLNFLVIGYLYAEGIISGIGDVASMRVCDEESEVDVRLSNTEFEVPQVSTLTSSCGGSVAFRNEGKRVDSSLVVSPDSVLSQMKQFLEQMELYRLSGGVHASALSDTRNLLLVSEDIGRHNTLYKIQGECLMKGLKTRDGMLMSTGRVSSEMLLKSSLMQAPIIVSRTSPTGRAVSLARDLGITLVGYARGNRLTVYSHPERLGR